MATSALPFSLRAFPVGGRVLAVTITGQAERNRETLQLFYRLAGDLNGLALPPPAAVPALKNRLWEDTCLEFFLAPNDRESYWEANFSPAGHWNLYRFDRYREGMAEEKQISTIPAQWHHTATGLELTLELDLAPLVAADQAIMVGINAVLRETSGAISHWALLHPQPQPDFHHRAGFLLTF